MKQLTRLLSVILAMAFFSVSVLAQEPLVNENLKPALTGDPDHEVEVYLLLKEQLGEEDLDQMKALREPVSRKALIPALVPALKNIAKTSQAGLVDFLVSSGVDQNSIRRYWIENIVYARVPERLLEELKGRKELLEIGLRTEIQWIESHDEEDKQQSTMQSSVLSEGGLQRINAPFMWRNGYTGYGTKILCIDSGVDPFHEALDRQNAWHNRDIEEVWIGTEGEAFTYDCESHGTHVIGTSVGLARENEDTIGVAFNAEWMAGNPIGCNVGFPQNTILEMFQWALNPDRNVNTTDDVPDVINNSWGDFSLGFCSNVYRNSLEVLENAGIAVIFSAGNAGPGERTVSPPGNLEINIVNPMTVGALTSSNNIADFSSRGPSRCFINGSRPVKPEVSAPGVDVRSSLPGNRYAEQQGTSMAAPHVAGACLLLMEAFPNLSARVIKEALYFSARDLGAPGEDNDYGRGIIDLERAYNYLTSGGNTPVSVDINVDVELWNVVLNQFGCDSDFSADVQLYNAGKSPVTSVEVELLLEGTNRRSSSTWTGTLLPGETAWFTLNPMDANAGEYDAIVRINDVNGSGKDQRALNDQMKRQVSLRSNNNYSVRINEAFGDLCNGSRALIQVSGADDADRYDWYNSFPLLPTVGSGRSFTPELEPGENQFYVLPEYDAQIGMEAPEESAMNFGYSGGRLQFDALQPFRLRSLDVFSSGFGQLGFLIRNEQDTVFQTAGYFATGGLQTLPINRTIPAGRDYEIVLYNNPGLGYAVQDVQFPYEVENVVNITGSTPPLDGDLPYYYFFNWDIEYVHPCGYKSILVEADGSGDVPQSQFSVNTTELQLPGNAQLITNNESVEADSYEWLFGDGTSSNETNPAHDYIMPGTYDVALIARNNSGCTDASVIEIEVRGMTANIEDDSQAVGFKIYPNPFTDQIRIAYPKEFAMGAGQIRIFNALGQPFAEYEKEETLRTQVIPTQSWSSGIYWIEFKFEGWQQSIKMIKP